MALLERILVVMLVYLPPRTPTITERTGAAVARQHIHESSATESEHTVEQQYRQPHRQKYDSDGGAVHAFLYCHWRIQGLCSTATWRLSVCTALRRSRQVSGRTGVQTAYTRT